MTNDPTLLCITHKVIDDVVCCSELSDLLLHGIFKNALLTLNQSPLLLVVCNALLIFPPIAAPPVAPGMTSGCSTEGPGIVTLFASGGTLSASAEAAALVAYDGEDASAAKKAEGDFQSDHIGCCFGWPGRKFRFRSVV